MILERLRQTEPTSAEVHLWLGHAYRREGSPARGAASYLIAARLAPDDPEVQLALGEAFELQGNRDAAERAYERAIDLGARVAAQRHLAMLLVARERYLEAIGVLRDWIDSGVTDATAYTLLGHACFLSQQFDAAIEAYEEGLSRDPDDLEAHYGLGVVLAERSSRHREALLHLQIGTQLDDRRAKAYEAIGRIHMEAGDLEAARQALRRSLETDPGLLQANYRLAQVLARLGDREGSAAAMQTFQRLEREARAARSDQRRIPSLKGGIYAAMAPGEDGGARDPARALQLARELVSVAPEDAEAWVLLAKVQISLGRIDRAAQVVTRALESDPTHWEALFVSALTAARQGRRDEAKQALRRSIERNPLFADAHAVLGNLLLGQDLVEQAIDEYRLALVLAPDRAAYHLNLATAYGKAGMVVEERAALDAYRRLLRSNRDR